MEYKREVWYIYSARKRGTLHERIETLGVFFGKFLRGTVHGSVPTLVGPTLLLLLLMKLGILLQIYN